MKRTSSTVSKSAAASSLTIPTSPAPPTSLNDAQRNVLRVLFNRAATKQELADELQLSLPTVTQHLKALHETGLIESTTDASAATSKQPSSGRPPRVYRIQADKHVAIGVQITETHVTIHVVNLLGKVIAEQTNAIVWQNSEAYRQRVMDFIAAVERKQTKLERTILGVGIAMDMRHEPFASAALQANLPFDLARVDVTNMRVVDIADARAIAELTHDPTLDNALFIHLDATPTSTLAINGTVLHLLSRDLRTNISTIPTANENADSSDIDANATTHQTTGSSSNSSDSTSSMIALAASLTSPAPSVLSIGDMVLNPTGPTCSCGARGCMHMYCSADALIEDGESVLGFFSVLEQGEIHHRARFNAWLNHLAHAIANVRSILTCSIIIDGFIAQFLDDTDIQMLAERVSRDTHTPLETTTAALVAQNAPTSALSNSMYASIRKGSTDSTSAAIGAALTYIHEYVNDLRQNKAV